jgi:cold-inducible RNA-binding protein
LPFSIRVRVCRQIKKLAAVFLVNSHFPRRSVRMDVKLYVGNLPYNATEDDLRTLFAQAGSVAAVDLIKDRMTGNSKGFGFIQMTTQAEAEKAISMFNGYSMNNRELKVSLARPKEETGRGGGGYGGPRRSDGGGYGRGGGGRDDRRGGGGGNRDY